MLALCRDWTDPGANRSAIAREKNMFPQSLRLMVTRFIAKNPNWRDELITPDHSA